MASYITTLQDDDRVNDIIPRTTIPAIADSNGNYLDDGLAASDINKLKNGEINKLESNLAQIETSPSTHAYSAGEFLVYNGILYKAKTSIAVNDSLVVGSNISAQTVSSAISDISASIISTVQNYQPHSNNWEYTGVSITIPSNCFFTFSAEGNYNYSPVRQVAIADSNSSLSASYVSASVNSDLFLPIATISGVTDNTPRTYYIWTIKANSTSSNTETIRVYGFYMKNNS